MKQKNATINGQEQEATKLCKKYRDTIFAYRDRINELEDEVNKLRSQMIEKKDLIDILSKQLKENIILFRHLELHKTNEWNDYLNHEYQDLNRKP